MDMTITQVAEAYNVTEKRVKELIESDIPFFSQWVTTIDDQTYIHSKAVKRIEQMLSENEKPEASVKPDVTPKKVNKTGISKRRRTKNNITKDYFKQQTVSKDVKAVRTFLLENNITSANQAAMMTDEEILALFGTRFICLSYGEDTLMFEKEALFSILSGVYKVKEVSHEAQ